MFRGIFSIIYRMLDDVLYNLKENVPEAVLNRKCSITKVLVLYHY